MRKGKSDYRRRVEWAMRTARSNPHEAERTADALELRYGAWEDFMEAVDTLLVELETDCEAEAQRLMSRADRTALRRRLKQFHEGLAAAGHITNIYDDLHSMLHEAVEEVDDGTH